MITRSRASYVSALDPSCPVKSEEPLQAGDDRGGTREEMAIAMQLYGDRPPSASRVRVTRLLEPAQLLEIPVDAVKLQLERLKTRILDCINRRRDPSATATQADGSAFC